ncbi:hypothetical protein [Companilactobacillus hulinensis]|uniref:hypothetical protein n=1 Tax=Companilactobacillus hulinensis TaxID=2486007 RepID=UPI000F777616|nr:hypothetical protein [Companilactobacillus hulinensis]
MTDKERLYKAARDAGVDFVPGIVDKNGKHVSAILGDGSYSYVDPRFDLSFFDEDKPGKERKDENR